jgi:hypothetical protein
MENDEQREKKNYQREKWKINSIIFLNIYEMKHLKIYS